MIWSLGLLQLVRDCYVSGNVSKEPYSPTEMEMIADHFYLSFSDYIHTRAREHNFNPPTIARDDCVFTKNDSNLIYGLETVTITWAPLTKQVRFRHGPMHDKELVVVSVNQPYTFAVKNIKHDFTNMETITRESFDTTYNRYELSGWNQENRVWVFDYVGVYSPVEEGD